jgi:hypothetical protein
MLSMAYDEGLAERIRDVVSTEPGHDEKKMFGGIAFMLNVNMAVGVSGDEVMVRVGVDGFDEAVAHTDVRPFEMKGRGMNGWVLAGGAAIAEPEGLQEWVDVGLAFAGSLPPK